MTDNNTSVPDNILEQNCREHWPLWTCVFGNVCGMCSTTLWFFVLLPQLWKNFRRKSVQGLSVLWATANFTASLINLFFVFMYAHIPLYGEISSVYGPILEFLLLVQFWIYDRSARKLKVAYAVGCVVIWVTVITVEIVFDVINTVEYAAIFLWCVETFPQILLNMKLQSTGGQANGMVVIAMIGKTTDFFATNLLVLPLQYVIMRYFSSSVAYVNGFQVAWYHGNDFIMSNQGESEKQQIRGRNDQFPNTSTFKGLSDFAASRNTSSMTVLTSDTKTKCNPRIVYIIRIICMCLFSCLLLMCVAVFVLNIESLYGLFAPVAILLVMAIAKFYFARSRRASYSLQ